MSKPSTCAACDTSRANAKAAGHRDWRHGVCFEHAGVNIDEVFARIGYMPDEASVARELAKMNAMFAARFAPSAPCQPDLFGAAA